MLSDQIRIDRRTFIQKATPFALAVPVFMRGHRIVARSGFEGDEIKRARQRLLEMVNRERGQHGLSKLELDELACQVATDHAEDMLAGMFLSHWGRDGRKPYQRYSFAGGTDAVQENAALASDVSTAPAEEIEITLGQLHQSMIDEVPPNDGHRRTILFPYHTHVGFGIAAKPDHIRLAELYITRYTEIGEVPRQAKPATRITFSGKLLNPKHSIAGIHVYREPLPRPPALQWLRQARPYSLPETFEPLWPRLEGSYIYADGTKGTIEISSRGHFRTPVPLFKEPAINTIVVWVQRKKNEEPFPVTQVCIRCE